MSKRIVNVDGEDVIVNEHKLSDDYIRDMVREQRKTLKVYTKGRFDEPAIPDQKVKQLKKLMTLDGELTYWKYLYEIFWGGYKRAKLLMPDKSLVRKIVDNMPYEPFGKKEDIQDIVPEKADKQ